LQLAAEHDGIAQSLICKIIDKSKSTISEAACKLEDMDLLESTTNQGKTKILACTRSGAIEAVGVHKPNGGQHEDICLHNFSVRFNLRGASSLEDSWHERLASKHERHVYDPSNDSHVYWRDSWRARVTGEHVILRLEHDLRGSDATNLKDRAMLEIFEAKDWLDSRLPGPAHIGNNVEDLRIWVARQHLAIINDPFASLVDQCPDVNMDDIKIYDENGQERLWLDNSNDEQHLEAGNAPGANRTHAEDDVQFIKSELYEWIIDNKQEWANLKDMAEDNLQALQEQKGRTQKHTISGEFTITSRWIHAYGHLMGWAEELGRPVKLIDESNMP